MQYQNKTLRTINVNDVLEQTNLSCWTVDVTANIPLLTFRPRHLDRIRHGADKAMLPENKENKHSL